MAQYENNGFLPINQEDMKARGWDEGVDFVCATGDAYVDHPSFGIAIVARVLEAQGHRVGILAQPDWKSDRDFLHFGKPKAFFVTGGNIDSMVAHYTAAKRKRSDDSYTAGNKAGMRPDRAVIVYCRKLRALWPDVPIIIGGVEASLRRFAHYDYWDDRVMPSILADSGADLLVFGMGEHQVKAIAGRLAAGERPADMADLRGICYLCKAGEMLPGVHLSIPSYEKVASDKSAYARATRQTMEEQDPVYGRAIVQKHGDRLLVQTPPEFPLGREELDAVFALPFMRAYHPSYEKLGGVKAIEEVEFSIIHNRGCFGSCHFCSIALHQGRVVTSRSQESVIAEAKALVASPRFKGYIHDVGGPTANFREPACQKQLTQGACKHRKCLAPEPCPHLQVDHRDYLLLLERLRNIKGVKRVFVRSGLRFDYINADKNKSFLRDLVAHHVSGQLKVAPEHCVPGVLAKMGKPKIAEYERFAGDFYAITQKLGQEQYLVPYLISSHPGCRLQDGVALAVWLKQHRIRPEQVQDFYPTPGTVSTAMFYTGLDPYTMEPVYVPRSEEEKRLQRALLQYYKPENRAIITDALYKAGRQDLIGRGKDCLVPSSGQPYYKDRTELKGKNKNR